MFKKSLETKILVILGLVLTSTLGFYALFDMVYEYEETYHMVYKHLEVLTNTIQKSLIKDMRSGRGSDVQEILEMVGTEPGIIAVRIFDDGGAVLKSARRSEVGQRVPDAIFGSYKSGERDFITEEFTGGVIHIVHPIANAPQCIGCHEKDKEIVGVLNLDYSLDLMESSTRGHGKRLAIALAVTITMAALAIFLLLKRMVNDPIVKLEAAMVSAEQGNLDISVKVGSSDEIGSLYKSFNRMLSRIKGLNEANLVQQKAIIEHEQELKVKEQLAEKNSALEAANREALDKNRYYMEMLSFISHELKGPLVVLKGYTSMLAAGDLEELKDSQLEAVHAMDRNVDALNDMIANYMDLSRLERGELSLTKRRVSIVDEVIRPLMFEYSEMLEKSSMSMRVECTEESPSLEADPDLMKAVFRNLVSNAVKYGRPGTDIIVEIERRDKNMRFSVFNEGQGIPAKDLDAVFGRFMRLENETTRAKKGTGLGLYLVKMIVGLHGGSVVAESKEGAWARIVCSVPAGGQEV